jgi:AcrR family transcriptional regulator
MASASTRPYGGVSAEERRAKRRTQLIEAGVDLLGTEGWQATTVRALCSRAGLTERYFYESFADRDALLVAVFDDVAGRAAVVVLSATQEAPHDERERSRAAIGAFVELLTGDPRLGRILLLEALGNEALERRRREALQVFAKLIADQAREFYGEGAPEPVDAMLTSTALVGALAELLIAWLDGSLDVPRQRLVDHCAELFVAAAGVRSSR